MIKTNSTSMERKIKKVIPPRLKLFLVSLFCSTLSGVLIQKIFKKTLKGARFNFSLVDPNSAALIFFGIWESAEIRFSEKYVNDGDYVIELGSSVGVTLATLISNKKLSKYIAIEASPRTFALLSKTVELYNENSTEITLLNKAISYQESGVIQFIESTLTASKISIDNQDNIHEKSVSVQSTTLNEIILNNLNIDVNFTLITDIEGAEAEIFKHDKKSLTRCSTIVCELENTEQYSMEEQIKLIEDADFKLAEYYGNVFAFKKYKINRKHKMS